MTRRAPHRGFTLIELMIAVALVGILASIAIPNYVNSTLRARKAERDTIVTAIIRGTQSILIRDGKFATPTYTGEWNPDASPGPNKRPFNHTVAPWKDLDLQIEGNVYHSYKFVGDQTGSPITLDIFAQGDLDGDGTVADRTVTYELVDGALWFKTDDKSAENIF